MSSSLKSIDSNGKSFAELKSSRVFSGVCTSALKIWKNSFCCLKILNLFVGAKTNFRLFFFHLSSPSESKLFVPHNFETRVFVSLLCCVKIKGTSLNLTNNNNAFNSSPASSAHLPFNVEINAKSSGTIKKLARFSDLTRSLRRF